MGEKKTGNDDTVLKLVEIFVKEKKNLTKQFLKVEQCHWNSHLKKMSSSKKETKKEKLSRDLKLEQSYLNSHLKKMSSPKKESKKEKLLREKLLPKLALIEVLKKKKKGARPQITLF